MPTPTPLSPEIWYAVGGPTCREMIQDETTARVIAASGAGCDVTPVVIADLADVKRLVSDYQDAIRAAGDPELIAHMHEIVHTFLPLLETQDG